MAVIVVVLALLAIVSRILFKGRAAEMRLGVPVRRIVSSDVGVDAPHSALFSQEHRVMGAPDYVVEDRCFTALIGGLASRISGKPFQAPRMPVEVKSAIVRQPREGDVIQLLTYCFLMEDNGYAVKRGRLVYANGQFDIPYGPEQRQEVMQVLEEIRMADKLSLPSLPQSKDQRCMGCHYQTICCQEVTT